MNDNLAQAAERRHNEASMNGDSVRSYAGKYESAKAKKDVQQGTMAQVLKEFEDKGGHKAALKQALKLKGMESSARAYYVQSLIQYASYLNVFEGDQGDMLANLQDGLAH